MSLTIHDIAKEAKVSIATVSRVLNNKPDVSEETREKIKNIIRENNYNPNEVARGLVWHKTDTIGLVIPSITNPFFPEVAKGIEDEARKNGYSVLLSTTENNKIREKEIIQVMKAKNVDGLIGSLTENKINNIEKLVGENISLIQIDRKIPDLDFPSVTIDNKLSGYLATIHLIKLGHKKIAHITGESNVKNTQDRLIGFKNALQENDLFYNKEWIKFGNPNIEDSGYKKMKELLHQKNQPTAVFFGNDIMAVDAYKAILEHGLKIPEDISIIGHDNIRLSSLIQPSLTTINQPKYELGKSAVQIMINKIQNEQKEVEDIILKPELIIRKSTKKLN